MPYFWYFNIILLCLMPDNFTTCQGESAGTQWVIKWNNCKIGPIETDESSSYV
jgi:hypothetical protein